MKESTKINLINLLKRHIHYVDGFWKLDKDLSTEEKVRNYIKSQGVPILEKDVTDILSELSFNKCKFDIDGYVRGRVASIAEQATGKSKYFASMDELYPGNKLREIMNYYLFSDETYCFILVGYGSTGKSTFVNLISTIIGEDFFGRSNVGQLKGSHGTSILESKILFEITEAQDIDVDTFNLLKDVISNNDIIINPKFQQQRKFRPHAKVIMTCNNYPRWKVTDDGAIRRNIPIVMNEKIKKQNKKFIEEMKADIPNIVKEALEHPFNIDDFVCEQYSIFENDPQYGFGYGKLSDVDSWSGSTDYEKYCSMCLAYGYHKRSKTSFDKFNELQKIYHERVECVITSQDWMD